MASQYLQKFPIPDHFGQILHDFMREILRVQPEDIIDFAEKYFEYMKDHPNGTTKDWDSKYNIKRSTMKRDDKKEYKPVSHKQLSNNAKRVVDISNERPSENKPPKPAVTDHTQTANNKRPPSGMDANTREEIKSHVAPLGGTQPTRTERVDSNRSQKGNTSHISHGSQASSGSHPEEKKITKDFIGGVYDSAINKVMTPMDNEENQTLTEEDRLGRNTKGVVLDGPQEEYDMAARQIQGNFKKKKTAAEEREIQTKARELKLLEKQSKKGQVGQDAGSSENKYNNEAEQEGEGEAENEQQIIEGKYQDEAYQGEGGEEMEEGYEEGEGGEEYEDGGEEYEGEIGFNRDQLMNLAAEAFAAADTDGSGFIEKGEFAKLLGDISTELGIPTPEPEVINQILGELDQNKDGKLSLEEFSVLVEQVIMAIINSLAEQGGMASGQEGEEGEEAN